jgi:choline kinase
MRGLILAAGRGSRLGGHADGTPKCLLEVGRRRLIEHQLEALADAGVAPVAMVVGYGADEVREAVGIRAEYIHNRRWDQTNSVYSYHLAREWLTGPIVLLNCDVLFHPDVLSRLLAAKGDALAYDSSSGSAPEQMKVKVKDGRVVDMAKDLPVEDCAGENLGVLYLTAETARALAERAGKVIEAGGENTWLSAAVRQMVAERPIQAIDVAGLPWGEIDSAYDLEHVRKKVWPAIEGSRRPVRRRRRLAQTALGALVLGGVAAALLGYDGMPTAGAKTDWDTAELHGLEKVGFPVGGLTQMWWMLDDHTAGELEIAGPGPLRIESRLLVEPAQLANAHTRIPYVLRVELDGRVVDFVRHVAVPDPQAPKQALAAAKRKRAELHVGPGKHRLRVTLVGAAQGSRCMLRVRESQPDDAEPDSEPDTDIDVANKG